MRYPSVLLVTPYSPGRYFGGVRPPVGMGYIEEYLRAHSIATDALDMNLGYRRRHLIRKISECKPSIVGFTLMSYQYQYTYDLIGSVKQAFPDIDIVIGGPHVSALEGKVLKQCASVGYAIAGEGEKPFLNLCRGMPLEHINGLYYRYRDEIVSGGEKEYLTDLDELPFPRYTSYPLHKYPEIEINTSRGCPYPCIFCAVSNSMGKRIRYRSAPVIGEELSFFYHEHGKRSFQIGDDNFLADKERVYQLVGEIESRHLKGMTLRCGQGIRSDLLDRDILLALKRAGFRHLGIGVESGSDKVLSVIRKGETAESIEKGIALACEMGFDVSLLFVIGTPTETLNDVEKSLMLAKKYPVMKAFFFNLIPFPGTSLYEWVKEHNAFLSPFDELINRKDELKLRSAPFFATKEMTEEDRIVALAITERVSRQIQVRTLERKLARWGIAGRIAAQAGRWNALERLFVKNRVLRRFLDHCIFPPHPFEETRE